MSSLLQAACDTILRRVQLGNEGDVKAKQTSVLASRELQEQGGALTVRCARILGRPHVQLLSGTEAALQHRGLLIISQVSSLQPIRVDEQMDLQSGS